LVKRVKSCSALRFLDVDAGAAADAVGGTQAAAATVTFGGFAKVFASLASLPLPVLDSILQFAGCAFFLIS